MKSRVVLIAVFALMLAGASAAQVPPNDACTTAMFVPQPMTMPDLNTTNATSDFVNDPDSACATYGDGVWYYFTPMVDGTTVINTCGSDYPAAIDLYFIDPPGSPACDKSYMIPVPNGCGGGYTGCPGLGSAITVTVTAGDTYYLHVFYPSIVKSADTRRTGGSLSLNLDGAVPAELVKVGID